ncbi:siderophore-interacting protein [Pseudonocardia acaciae]|uniref:siderophore-interacting protein n=1 Tax=Pseudonocardia acaciae TaxID=551276 RepID=UPI0004902064|nr:siderophore-interacting protein [Pseudonocardia acaciae]
MADRGPRKAPATTRLLVRRTERVTPHMIRVVAAPDDPGALARFAESPHTDAYVKVVFRRPEVGYPEPFDMERVRAELPREHWPALRTYTIRAVDTEAGEVTIDFVHHGDEGLAGPWAATAGPGTELLVLGPGGAYSPDPTADWHLFVGDEAALPAIAAALARVPSGVPAYAFVEVEDAAERQDLPCPGDLRLRWLLRSEAGQDAILDEVRGFDFPAGRVHAFVHGEANAVKLLRRHLLHERGLTMDQLSISGYWRRGFDDESYRAVKRADLEAEAKRDAELSAAGRR